MRELQKYYAEFLDGNFDNFESALYLASEADAAFAEMRREHFANLTDQQTRHAEEVERLKAEHEQERRTLWEALEHATKYAEQYQNLRRLKVRGDGRFDDLVDQLPASGEASQPMKAMELCQDCPPRGWLTDETRCANCPRRNLMPASGEASADEQARRTE